VASGTYDYFTEAIVQREHASRGDFTSSEDDNVLVRCVANDELALGFFGYAYYHENRAKLKLLAVDDGNSENGAGAVTPSKATIGDGTYQPLSRPIFIYVSKRALARREVAEFVGFYLSAAPRLVDDVGYLALPQATYAVVRQRMAARRTGSVFGGKGSQIGVTIESLLTKEQAAASQ
jgi:phosphate transport system substrate-binding protein